MHLENNILIAEFMGNIDHATNEYYRIIFHSGDFHKLDDLYFHDSWDWLMPVIQKIKNMNLEGPSMTDKIDFYLTGCNLKYTYESVVEFIKNIQS